MSDPCRPLHRLVCAGAEHDDYGNYDQQAKAATIAIHAAGGVHPDCPSLIRFGPFDAAAWLHQGATNWLNSTLIDRGGISSASPRAVREHEA